MIAPLAPPEKSSGRFSPRPPILALFAVSSSNAERMRSSSSTSSASDRPCLNRSSRSMSVESAKISRKRQPMRQGKAVFFAVPDHLATDALRRHSSESNRSRPGCQESRCLASTPAATIRVNLRACPQQQPMRSIIDRSTIKVKCRA